MSGNDSVGRIRKVNFLATSITIFTISILLAVARTAIRLRIQKRLFLDDLFLLLAVVCLSAAITLLVFFSPSLYLVETFAAKTLTKELLQYLKLSDVYFCMTWTTLFAVKFSFLFFFRAFIRRVPAMALYWLVVSAITALVWVYCITGAFIVCPYFDARAYVAECTKESDFSKALGIAASSTFLDIVTDILIMVIPIHLLRNIQVNFRQKLGLGGSLCLLITMVVLTIVRLSRFHLASASVDFTWSIFWQFAEGCIAVAMVSLTAFRSLFISHATQQGLENVPYSGRKRLWAGKNSPDVDEDNFGSQELHGLPDIPQPTMTGTRTLIVGERRLSRSGFLRCKGSHDSREPWALQAGLGSQGIRVQQSVSMDTEVIGLEHVVPISLESH